MVLRNINWGQVVYAAATLASSWMFMTWVVNQLDPNRPQLKAAKHRHAELEKRLGRRLPKLQGLEAAIAAEVVDFNSISVTLADIGGLGEIIKALVDNVIMPLRRPELFQSSLLRQPKGVLLYGPPGTGKTMLAKALAKESGAIFINIRASVVQSKWYGDSHKLCNAIFSLAEKLAPAVIFLDEVDGLLGRRREQDHEATISLKTEFMQLWDGFLSDRRVNVLVMGATNRPSELDDAVLRRFQLKFPVPLPGVEQREAILRATLQKHALEHTLDPQLLCNQPLASGERPLQVVARQTEGFSGSDLFDLCAQAAVIPVHEFIEADRDGDTAAGRPRPMNLSDLQTALGEHSHRATQQTLNNSRAADAAHVWMHMVNCQAMLAWQLSNARRLPQAQSSDQSEITPFSIEGP